MLIALPVLPPQQAAVGLVHISTGTPPHWHTADRTMIERINRPVGFT